MIAEMKSSLSRHNNRKVNYMDKRTKPKPKDFLKVINILQKENRLSVNAIKTHYDIASHSVINRWLSESNISIEKSNKKKEELIDMIDFISDCRSGNFSLNDISDKYGISRRSVNNIIVRNNITNTRFISEKFDPDLNEFLEIANRHSSKTDIARHYNTTLSIILNYCKKNNITEKVNELIEPIDPLLLQEECGKNPNHTIGSLGKRFSLNPSVIKRILEKNNFSLPENQFTVWENQLQEILDNISFYADQNKRKTLLEISNEFGLSIEQLKKAFKISGIQICIHSSNKSKGEHEVRNFVRSLDVDCFSLKKTYNGKQYEIDCFIPEKSVGIEFCGEYWHSTTTGTPKNYHKDKLIWCNGQGIELITIFQHEWYQKQEIVKSMIRHKIGKTPNRIFARNTEIVEIDSHTAREFHENNHLNGYINSKINIGLKNKKNGELVSVFSISKSRFDKSCDFEITRFSTLLNHHVVGGLSKLIKYAKQFGSILTYVDLRFGNGKSYKLSGFETVYDIGQPNYFYFNKKDAFAKFQSRISFQKHKLKSLFPGIYEDALTEKEIMEKAGYLQIYDCGNSKLRLDKQKNNK